MLAIFSFLFCLTASPAFCIGGPKYISNKSAPGSFGLVQAGKAATLVVDHADWPGVVRAVGDLQTDIEHVTNCRPNVHNDVIAADLEEVVIGTIGKSPLVDDLIRRGKLDVSDINRKWESAVTKIVDEPFPGVRRALIIAGSDKRGTIFGIYDLSEQIGVSPWYWWADVRIPHQDELFVLDGRYMQSEPAVKYRGIFLNDEAPALTGWAKEKFGGLNSNFYAHVFELLLRLKANYLWPAMWSNAFNEDDPEDPKMADMYGVVMGTSHHEPMLRSQQEWKRHGSGPWNYVDNGAELRNFWRAGIERNKDLESTITVGMRGDGDMAMSSKNDVGLLEGIVRDQEQILDGVSSPVLKGDPRVWALYKEVQGYYEDGMRVPDDVTLLWSDDNWGDIRRLPSAAERNRSGGAGVYYHFDYVGGPRNYKWINTNQIPKIWEQMHLALEYGADRLWVVNVGDLKPMEIPIEFFLNYARSPQQWNAGNLHEYMVAWATREFGPEQADGIARAVEDYTRYNARRKPELISPQTFSTANFREADRVQAEWEDLKGRVRLIAKDLPQSEKPSFFELVQYPVDACAAVTEMYISAGRNALAAQQKRSIANDYAALTKKLFDEDARFASIYNHELLNGRWDHMMDQVHIGYTSWSDPPENIMPAVRTVEVAPQGKLGVAVGDKSGTTLSLAEFDSVGQQTKQLTLFNEGASAVAYHVKADVPWVLLGHNGATQDGSVEKEVEIPVHVDWSAAPAGIVHAVLEVSGPLGVVSNISLTSRRQTLDRSNANGFVESDGYIAIESAHTSSRSTDQGVSWIEIPGYGRTFSAMTISPGNEASAVASKAGLHYRLNTYDTGSFSLQLVLSPTLNFVPGRGLRLAISVDNGPRMTVDTLEHNDEGAWSRAVSDAAKTVNVPLNISTPGEHTLHVWFVDPGVVLQRLVLSHGPLPYSYLGPPESFHMLNSEAH